MNRKTDQQLNDLLQIEIDPQLKHPPKEKRKLLKQLCTARDGSIFPLQSTNAQLAETDFNYQQQINKDLLMSSRTHLSLVDDLREQKQKINQIKSQLVSPNFIERLLATQKRTELTQNTMLPSLYKQSGSLSPKFKLDELQTADSFAKYLKDVVMQQNKQAQQQSQLSNQQSKPKGEVIKSIDKILSNQLTETIISDQDVKALTKSQELREQLLGSTNQIDVDQFRRTLNQNQVQSIKIRNKIQQKIQQVLIPKLTQEEYDRLEYLVTQQNLEHMTQVKVDREKVRLQQLRLKQIQSNFQKLENKNSQFLSSLSKLRTRRRTLANISSNQIKFLQKTDSSVNSIKNLNRQSLTSLQQASNDLQMITSPSIVSVQKLMLPVIHQEASMAGQLLKQRQPGFTFPSLEQHGNSTLRLTAFSSPSSDFQRGYIYFD